MCFDNIFLPHSPVSANSLTFYSPNILFLKTYQVQLMLSLFSWVCELLLECGGYRRTNTPKEN